MDNLNRELDGLLAAYREACPAPEPILASRLAPFFLLVFASVETLNDGLNGSSRHPPVWNLEETFAATPSVEVTVPVIAVGVQLVGLNMNPGLSNVTSTRRTRNGIPSMIVGTGSEIAVTCAVCGSIRSD